MLICELDVEARVPNSTIGLDASNISVARYTRKQSCQNSELLRCELHDNGLASLSTDTVMLTEGKREDPANSGNLGPSCAWEMLITSDLHACL